MMTAEQRVLHGRQRQSVGFIVVIVAVVVVIVVVSGFHRRLV